MHAIQDSIRTWMKDGCVWCMNKMRGERVEEETGAKIHLRAEDGQGVGLKLVLSKCRVVIQCFSLDLERKMISQKMRKNGTGHHKKNYGFDSQQLL